MERGGWRRTSAVCGLLCVIALAILSLAAAGPAGAARAFGSVAITSFPKTITIGQTVTIKGFVTDGAGIDVTVRLYTLPQCSSGSTQLAVLTAGPDGSFTYTGTLEVNPPVAYGFIVGLSQDPTRTPNFDNPDSCVNIEAGAPLSGRSEGSVTVDGSPFDSGAIPYGSTVDLGVDSAVKLAADAGNFRVFPVSGQGTSFIPVRVALPLKKGQKKRQYIVEMRLVGGDFSSCKKNKKTVGLRTESGKKPGPERSLWGNGKGHYRTKGRYSSATVSGTWWLVEDRCDGTLTVVRRGTVIVTDFVRHTTVVITAGHRYLAKPAG